MGSFSCLSRSSSDAVDSTEPGDVMFILKTVKVFVCFTCNYFWFPSGTVQCCSCSSDLLLSLLFCVDFSHSFFDRFFSGTCFDHKVFGSWMLQLLSGFVGESLRRGLLAIPCPSELFQEDMYQGGFAALASFRLFNFLFS